MCVEKCSSEERARRMKEGYCVYCHPLTEMREEWVQDKTGLPIGADAPDAFRLLRCPTCRTFWAPSALDARPPGEPSR